MNQTETSRPKTFRAMQRRILSLTAVITAAAVLTGGWVLHRQRADDLFELKKNFEIFGALYEQVILNYVDDVRPGPFMRAGVDAMLTRLDPYTQFYDQADNVDLDLMRPGSLADVGLNIGLRDGRVTVLAPELDTDAYRRGVRTGDVILRVNGVDVEGWTVADVAGLLRGDEGSTVTVDVEREGEPAALSFTLLRAAARQENVAYAGLLENAEGRIGYVRLRVFGNRAAREVRRSLRDLEDAGDLDAVVLDLRDNPGGILGEATRTVGLFVPKGTPVVSTRGRIEDIAQNYTTDDDPFFSDIPVVVLVNEISASASEIVSGALQDLDRAVIVGRTTYGKGLIQIMRELPYNTSMKITIGHYYTPSGRDIQSHRIASTAAEVTAPDVQRFSTRSGREVRSGVGIEPDVPIEAVSESELERALVRGGMFFRYANHFAAEHPGAAEADLDLSDDALLGPFERWLAAEGFSYRTHADVLLDSLGAELTRQEHLRAARAVADARRIAEDEKAGEFERSGAEIADRLRSEIRSRFLAEPDRIARSLDDDPFVLRAVELLRDRRAYDNLLGR
jgi:carboxyl-terminal processing protease